MLADYCRTLGIDVPEAKCNRKATTVIGNEYILCIVSKYRLSSNFNSTSLKSLV
jgi:hypothetical protein